MGHATNIYGIISFPSFGSITEEIWNGNMKIINSLPNEDNTFPWITNKMFSKEFQPGWDERHIHFSANYKNLEFELQVWISKFETLLKRLMWLSVRAQIETEISGDFEIEWNIHEDALINWKEDKWTPTTIWISKGLIKK